MLAQRHETCARPELLDAQGLARRIRTAAITYDPEFDRVERLRVYGKDRAVRMDENHRMLRAIEGNDELREYFELGVNFIESLVNRHPGSRFPLNVSTGMRSKL